MTTIQKSSMTLPDPTFTPEDIKNIIALDLTAAETTIP